MRIEKDSTGSIRIPDNAYYGSFTARALQNFKISGIKAPVVFKNALALVKKAAAQANGSLGTLSQKYVKAIIKAADELIAGKFDSEFVLDIFQAGAGTPYNMNANEILANRANELLGGKKGQYSPLHPNNHINLGQSSNDVIPTATRISILFALKPLIEEAEKLQKSLASHAKAFAKIKKAGRTHLQDAVPMTLGDEFRAYEYYIKSGIQRIHTASTQLLELGIGGTALGTGINTHPHFADEIIKNLGKLCGFKFRETKNKFALTSSHTAFIATASALKALATDLNKIANDLKILSSGPKAGIAEIILPEVEPGSSIMPGKVNPSVPECITQIYAQVVGCEHTVDVCCNEGHLELNTMAPTIMYNILWATQILQNGISMFRTDCIDGIRADKARITALLDGSLVTATSLVPNLGYAKTAELVKSALKNGRTLKEELKLLK